MHKHSPVTLEQLPRRFRRYTGEVELILYPPQGATSDVAVVHGRKGKFVVKRANQPPYDGWLRREHVTLNGLIVTALPVPQVYELWFEGKDTWLLMSALSGEPLSAVLSRPVEAEERRRLLFEFGRALAQLHTCRMPAELAREIDWTGDMLEQAEFSLQNYAVDGTAELLERLKRERPEPAPLTLIHGDATLDNVLFEGGQVTGWIDWAGGGIGDRRYDLALATRPQPEAFQDEADQEAFYRGYESVDQALAGKRLSEAEAEFFLGLDEFF